MSYINRAVFEKSALELGDISILYFIKQLDTEFLLERVSEDIYKRLEALSLINHIKQKKKDEHAYTSLRLSQQGKTLLTKLEEAPIDEQDKTVGEWLCKYYLDAGKEIGNKRKTFRFIRDFRIKSGIEKNNLIKLCVDFLKENEEKSHRLEYVFFYPKNVFEVKLDLDSSWLYQFYLKNKERLESTFEIY